jgi:hypothetical protein
MFVCDTIPSWIKAIHYTYTWNIFHYSDTDSRQLFSPKQKLTNKLTNKAKDKRGGNMSWYDYEG